MTNEERDRFIAGLLNEGCSLSEVQKRLADELGITMTYLDLRLLAADLEVDWASQEPAEPPPVPEDTDLLEPEPEAGGGTKVTVSKLVRPGAAMSGEVAFASGAKGEWFVDAMGRLGMNLDPDSPQPTQEDVREFQMELQKKLSGTA